MQPELFELHARVEERHWWFVARRRIMRQVLQEVLPPGQGRLVVDVGCGTGANIASLADVYSCIGIDTSEVAIRFARQRFESVRFIHGLAPLDLSEEAERMDAVLMMDVLEHVEDDSALLAKQVNALKPGGVLLLTVPADMRLWSEHDVSFGHHRRYDLEGFRSVWNDLGIEELMLSYFNTRLYPVVRAIRALNRLRGKAWGRSGTDLSIPPGPVNRLLERCFAGESRCLIALLDGHRNKGYGYGVSLIAVLRKPLESE